MRELTFKKTVKSQLDNTIKYVFSTYDNLIVEFSYLDKNDGKDIICVPCQTMCPIGCKFCHTTEFIGKIKIRNLTSEEIIDGIKYIYEELNLAASEKTLLISYMGCGEPLYNIDHVLRSMVFLSRATFHIASSRIRFALATCLPEYATKEFIELCRTVKSMNLNVKLHFSLHYTNDVIRKEWMSRSLDINSSLALLTYYKSYTGRPVEVHYALIHYLNDSVADADTLGTLLCGTDFDVKFLFYNEKENLEYHAATMASYEMFKTRMEFYRIPKCEYYKPVGIDVGASCGQFMME